MRERIDEPTTGASPVPSLVEDHEREETEPTSLQRVIGTNDADGTRRPRLIVIGGDLVGHAFDIAQDELLIGRGIEANVRVRERGISRLHFKIRRNGDEFEVVDLESANGTYVNERRIQKPVSLRDGDRIRVGTRTYFRFVFQDEIDEEYQRFVFEAATSSEVRCLRRAPVAWTPQSWETKTAQQAISYPDPARLAGTLSKLSSLPPLVTSWEIERLKQLIAEAQEGRRFLLQGGDCAETITECQPGFITNKLKILMQMSLVLVHGTRKPVIRVGRFAGQYAKPRSKPTEVRGNQELPSYFGDLVNRPEFNREARTPNPDYLVECYFHAASTLNFIRSLALSGYTDIRNPEYFDLSFFERAALSPNVRQEYRRICSDITNGLHFMTTVGAGAAEDLLDMSFFTSHEGLNLLYEASLTRRPPRRTGFYDSSTHLPWIGERTRDLSGAHVEFFRGVENPIGVKVGPSTDPGDLLDLCDILNPNNEPGKLVLISRLGVRQVAAKLPRLIDVVRTARRRVLWICDPMHGNTVTTSSGVKTRNFADILEEVIISMQLHADHGSRLGGVHFELTGEDVTECIGGAVKETDLHNGYMTLCDPRLNYSQAIEMALCIARHLGEPSPSTMPPPP